MSSNPATKDTARTGGGRGVGEVGHVRGGRRMGMSGKRRQGQAGEKDKGLIPSVTFHYFSLLFTTFHYFSMLLGHNTQPLLHIVPRTTLRVHAQVQVSAYACV